MHDLVSLYECVCVVELLKKMVGGNLGNDVLIRYWTFCKAKEGRII